MRWLALALPLLLAVPASATLYRWEGTVDSVTSPENNDVPESTFVWGTFDLSPTLGVNKLSLFWGPYSFSTTGETWNTAWINNGGLRIDDVPITNPDIEVGGDFGLDESMGLWSFVYRASRGTSEASGKLVKLGTYGDAHPTPEPSSFVLMGSALAGFGLYRRRRLSRTQ